MSLILETNGFIVRNTYPEDLPQVQALCKRVYPFSLPYKEETLKKHLDIFPQGQLVVEEVQTEKVVGAAFCLIVNWDDYEISDDWKEFTDAGTFENHDPVNGRTLYGAEVMVDPEYRGKGLGHALYKARRKIVRQLGLKRIRAGARIPGYQTYFEEMSAKDYLLKVIQGQIFDPTLSFQLKHDFNVLYLVPNYLPSDVESKGFAVVIEWLNPEVATISDLEKQRNFLKKMYGDEVKDVNHIHRGQHGITDEDDK